MYMLSTVTILGYWTRATRCTKPRWTAPARQAVEIIRYVGDNKWIRAQDRQRRSARVTTVTRMTLSAARIGPST